MQFWRWAFIAYFLASFYVLSFGVLSAATKVPAPKAKELGRSKAPLLVRSSPWTGYYGGVLMALSHSAIQHNLQLFSPAPQYKSLDFTFFHWLVSPGIYIGFNKFLSPSYIFSLEGDFAWLSWETAPVRRELLLVPWQSELMLIFRRKFEQLFNIRMRLGYMAKAYLFYASLGFSSLTGREIIEGRLFAGADSAMQDDIAAFWRFRQSGADFGLGFDYHLPNNLFLRGELRYQLYKQLKDSLILADYNIGYKIFMLRFGVGYSFSIKGNRSGVTL